MGAAIGLRRIPRALLAAACAQALMSAVVASPASGAEPSDVAVCTWGPGQDDQGIPRNEALVFLPTNGSAVTLSVAEDRTILVADALAERTVTCLDTGGTAARAGVVSHIAVVGTTGDDRVMVVQSGPQRFPRSLTFDVDLGQAFDGSVEGDVFAYVGPAVSSNLVFERAGSVRMDSQVATSVLRGVELVQVAMGDADDVVDAGSWTGPTLSIALGGGDDRFVASAGDDVADGGASDPVAGGGGDTVSYAAMTEGVRVDLGVAATPQETGGGGADALSGFEVVVGTAAADELVGSAGDDVLQGGAGDDVLSCGGGDGDWVSYADAAPTDGRGVRVALGDVAAQDTGWGEDTLSGCERLRGSDGDDVLRGSTGPNALWGGDGDDRLIGLGGSDTLDGGDGADIADYGWASGRVDAALVSRGGDPYPRASVTGVGADWLVRIEHLVGGRGDDLLVGSAGDNDLRGGPGDDELRGGRGDDRLFGGAGADRLVGAMGRDRCLLGPGGAVARSCEV